MSKSLRGLSSLEAVACCPPLTTEPLSPDSAESAATLLRALADPVRLRLLSLVAAHEDGESCVCDLNEAFDLSQPTISHHLKVLHEAGLLERSKRGVWVYYRVNASALAHVSALLGGVAEAGPRAHRQSGRGTRPVGAGAGGPERLEVLA